MTIIAIPPNPIHVRVEDDVDDVDQMHSVHCHCDDCDPDRAHDEAA